MNKDSPKWKHIKTFQIKCVHLLVSAHHGSKQLPRIVGEQLNDDENKWKRRYEFSAFRLFTLQPSAISRTAVRI